MTRILALALLVALPAYAAKNVTVKPHITKQGTYVAPSNRTAPNKTQTDNYGSKGNTNPYTGKEGTKEPTK